MKVVLFGTGDFARIASVYLDEDSEHEVVAFTVDESHIDAPELLGRPVVPFEQLTERYPPSDYAAFVAIGFSRLNQARADVFARMKELGYRLISYVNSTVNLWGDVQIGENTFVFEENVVQPFVRIGDNCVLWSGNHIGHDATIGNHVFIASHAVISGNVTIGDYSFIGVNATFRDAITVAPRNVIGAGAVIMRDTEEGDVYAVRNTDPFPKKSWELKSL